VELKMAIRSRAPWIPALEDETRLDRANAALMRLGDSLREADQAIERAESELREAGLAQSSAEFHLGHELNFEAASTRIFLQHQLTIIRRRIQERIAGVVNTRTRLEEESAKVWHMVGSASMW
jgi:hypothetical protein